MYNRRRSQKLRSNAAEDDTLDLLRYPIYIGGTNLIGTLLTVVGVGKLAHGVSWCIMVYQLRTVSDDSRGASTSIIVDPVPNTKKRSLKFSKRKRSNEADGITQLALGQHPNWVSNATTR